MNHINNEYSSFSSDIDRYIETLLRCEFISEEEVKNLCEKAKEILMKMDNLVYLSAPIIVILTLLTLLKSLITYKLYLISIDLRRYSRAIL